MNIERENKDFGAKRRDIKNNFFECLINWERFYFVPKIFFDRPHTKTVA